MQLTEQHVIRKSDPRFAAIDAAAFASKWTNSYFVSTVGGAPLVVIKQYIEN